MNNTNKRDKTKLELNEERREIFLKAIEEARKIKKSKIKQDISCGKVVCFIKKEKKHKSK